MLCCKHDLTYCTVFHLSALASICGKVPRNHHHHIIYNWTSPFDPNWNGGVVCSWRYAGKLQDAVIAQGTNVRWRWQGQVSQPWRYVGGYLEGTEFNATVQSPLTVTYEVSRPGWIKRGRVCLEIHVPTRRCRYVGRKYVWEENISRWRINALFYWRRAFLSSKPRWKVLRRV